MEDVCYCSIIDGRKFLCEGCARKLKEELEVLKDDHTELKLANKALQDDLEEATKRARRLQNTISALTKGKEARIS